MVASQERERERETWSRIVRDNATLSDTINVIKRNDLIIVQGILRLL